MNCFEITAQTIDPDAFRKKLLDPSCGAYVQFDGWVRNHNEGQRVLRLEYEVYEPLAVKEGQCIIDEASRRVQGLTLPACFAAPIAERVT